MIRTGKSYTRGEIADFLTSLPREDQQWSLQYLVSIVETRPVVEKVAESLAEAKEEPKPKRKKIQIRRSDIERVRQMSAFGHCNVPADLDVRGILAEKYM